MAVIILVKLFAVSPLNHENFLICTINSMVDLLIKEQTMITHRFSEHSSSRISSCIVGRTQAWEASSSYENLIYLRFSRSGLWES